MTDLVSFASPHVCAQIRHTAGILTAPEFRLPSGRWVRPLAQAPWVGNPDVTQDMRFPGHIRWLGGEFLCLPFGGTAAWPAFPADWQRWPQAVTCDPMHGPAADRDWSVAAATPDSVTIRFEQPDSAEINRIERTFRCHPESPRIDITTRLTARRDAAVTMCLHPILRMPEQERALELCVTFGRGYCYPVLSSPNPLGRPNAQFANLSAVPLPEGGDYDASAWPTGRIVDEMLLLCRVRGPFVARYHDENYAVSIDWDKAMLPNMTLWLEDRCIQDEPWLGRFRGIGVEPSAAAHDLAPLISGDPQNPLARLGETTALHVRAGQTLEIASSIAVDEL
jgi:galactose mutarotase-like enzyme